MDKTIKVELSASGIDEAIRQIEDFQKELNRRNQEFVNTLAQEGIQTLNAHFPNGGKTVSDKGIETGSDSSHSTHIDDMSSTTRAAADMVVEGPDLLFIEFGAGVHYNGAVGTSPHPWGAEMGYTIGSYGAGHGAQNVWGYSNGGGTTLTYGTPASKPVYDAYLDMRSRGLDVAIRVFR